MVERSELRPLEGTVVIPTELPTTLEIAKEGVLQFTHVLEAARMPEVKQLLVEHKKLQSCFLGIAPEVYIGERDSTAALTPEEFLDFSGAMETVSPFISPFAVKLPFRNGNQKIGTSFVNQKAAMHVIQHNPSHFPVIAQEDPLSWLRNSEKDWHDPSSGDSRIDVRYGLLSGFPAWAVEQFSTYKLIPELVAFHGFSEEDLEFLFVTFRETKERTPEMEQEAADQIKRLLTIVPDDRIDLFLRHRRVITVLGNTYIGFDRERDDTYVDELNDIYYRSGMESVLNEYEVELQKPLEEWGE